MTDLAPPPPARRSSRAVLVGLGCFGGFVLLCILGVVATMVLVPFELVDGDELSDRHRRTLVQAGLLEPDETVVLFYSAGLTSVLEEGNLLTDRRVVSWTRDGDTGEMAYLHEAPLDRICDARLDTPGNALTDSTLAALIVDRDAVYLHCPAENGQDERFIAAIRERMTGRPVVPLELRSGDELDDGLLRLLRVEGILEPGESVELLYSAGPMSVLDDGNLLTDRRVVTWSRAPDDPDAVVSYGAPFADLDSVEITERGDAVHDSLIVVTGPHGDEIQLWCPAWEDQDQAFVAAIRARLGGD